MVMVMRIGDTIRQALHRLQRMQHLVDQLCLVAYHDNLVVCSLATRYILQC
jgi:hypothetical protein